MRKWLKDMGVRIVELDGLHDNAVYIEDVACDDGTTSVLVVRAGISPCDLARAAEMVLLDQVPSPRAPFGP